MNFEELEERVSQRGVISYWKDDVLIGRKCRKCGESKEINEFPIRDKRKNSYKSICKQCNNNWHKQYYKENAETFKEAVKQNRAKKKEYYTEKDRQYYQKNAERIKERTRNYRENHKEHYKEYNKRYRIEHLEQIKAWEKQYRLENEEHIKERQKKYYQENKEHYQEQKKQRYESIKQENFQKTAEMLEDARPLFKELNLPIFGYIYKFENKKTGRVYIGQTIQPLNMRYRTDIIQGWIRDRKRKRTQKFVEELIEEDFVVTEALDIGFCRYHLDKLEIHYINKYNAYEDGYNNCVGYWKRNDGIEEFENILNQYNLEYINGELRRICDE